ncbi:MAG: peptidoglycan binding domain-containing protein [Blautia sp.]|nr:peptidoglycan binding domain-containing protein [Blautia sp.]MDY3998306.1 peptidoglycan binding domain-containing protein [Blautia sp.]
MSNEKKRKIFSDGDNHWEEPALDEFNEEIFDGDFIEEDDYAEESAENEELEEYDEDFAEDEAPAEYDEDFAEDEALAEYDEDFAEDEVPAEYDEDFAEDEAPAEYDEGFAEDEAPAEYDEDFAEDEDPAVYDEDYEEDAEEYEEEKVLKFQPMEKGRPLELEDDKTAGVKHHQGKRKSARPKPVVYVPLDEDEMQIPQMPSRKKHKGLKVTGVVALMVIAAAGCAYAGVSYFYTDKFFDGTTINGIDCSRKTPYEVEQLIAQNVENYSIQVASRNLEPQTIDGDQIEYTYVSDGEVMKLLKQQKPYEWIRGFFEEKSYTTSENITYNKELLQSQVLQLNCAQEENQVAPENAYVAFTDTAFEIIPETEGSALNVKEAYHILDEAISGKQETVDFASSEDAYEAAAVTSDDPGLQATLAACNNFTQASITYTFGDQTVTLDGSTVKDWLEFDEKGQYVQDDAAFQQHVRDYVAQLAAQYDTVGTDREFYTTSGRTVYVYGSAYGWKIDQDAETAQLISEIQSGTQTTRDPVYSMTANTRGYNDIGSTYIEVDLSAQHMYYYQDGVIIFDSDIVSGNMSYSDRQTPSGIYTLYYKKSPDVLRGQKKEDGKYEYEVDVQYWMPFNGGIGFHDAPWQPYFGGDRYLANGSHGCINLPSDSAAVLYSIIQYGVPIVCFY